LLFDPNERSFSLMTNAASVVVTATSVVPFSEVQVNDEIVPFGSSSQPIALEEGIETITINVEAPDTTRESYSIELEVDRTAPEIELRPNPTTPTNTNVVVGVEVTESGSGISEVRWASGEQAADYFGTEG